MSGRLGIRVVLACTLALGLLAGPAPGRGTPSNSSSPTGHHGGGGGYISPIQMQLSVLLGMQYNQELIRQRHILVAVLKKKQQSLMATLRKTTAVLDDVRDQLAAAPAPAPATLTKLKRRRAALLRKKVYLAKTLEQIGHVIRHNGG